MNHKSLAEIIVENIFAAGVKRIYGVVGDRLTGKAFLSGLPKNNPGYPAPDSPCRDNA